MQFGKGGPTVDGNEERRYRSATEDGGVKRIGEWRQRRGLMAKEHGVDEEAASRVACQEGRQRRVLSGRQSRRRWAMAALACKGGDEKGMTAKVDVGNDNRHDSYTDGDGGQ